MCHVRQAQGPEQRPVLPDARAYGTRARTPQDELEPLAAGATREAAE